MNRRMADFKMGVFQITILEMCTLTLQQGLKQDNGQRWPQFNDINSCIVTISPTQNSHYLCSNPPVKTDK